MAPREQKTMTKNSYLKHEIRTRMALTGESYSAASSAIGRGEELPASAGAKPTADLRALVIFTERLQTLTSMGMSIRRAFETLIPRTDDPVLKEALIAVCGADDELFSKEIRSRTEAFPGIFPDVLSSGFDLSVGFASLAKVYRTELEMAHLKAVPAASETIDPALASVLESLEQKRRERAKPLAVFIGSEVVGQALEQVQDSWKFRRTFPTVDELLRVAREDGFLKENSIRGYIIADKDLDSVDRETFMDMRRVSPPEIFFGVVDYGNEDDPNWSTDTKNGQIYSIDPKRPKITMDEAMESYLNGR